MKTHAMTVFILVSGVAYAADEPAAPRTDEKVVPHLDISWVSKIQKQVDDLNEALKKEVRIPTGTIVAFYGNEAPKGWMLCDGSTIPTEFEALRKLVGDKVPDLRGVFLRGANHGRTDGKGDVEVERRAGTYQDDLFEKHSHYLSLPGAAGNNAFVNRDPAWGYDNWHGATRTAHSNEQGGAETRPKNVSVSYIIKI